ncbi:hypothetical protein [Mycolicibacter sinensis]|uniref:hypothetical protein n=1 Tax=Mycolicibacter sinensis (strain JDM601) TaxID=875328 RepID=UPI000ABADC88|nr:hypothetical protein [Mycolicibacter sinensis]
MSSSRSISTAISRIAGAAVLAGAMAVIGVPAGEVAVAAASPAVAGPSVPADLPPGVDGMPLGGGWGHGGGGHGGGGHGGWGHGNVGKGNWGNNGWINGGRINGFIHSGGRGGW